MENLIKSYIEWLNKKITFRQIGEWFEITTPYLNHHNDYIQLFAKKDERKILLSDDGITIDELEMAGVTIDRSEKRKSELSIILNNFGIKRESNNELILSCNETNFPESKHRFIQALLSVYDMYLLSEAKVESFFFDDVCKYFDAHDVRYTPNVQFTGKSNFSHHFDFSIPKSKNSLERLIKLLNTPRKDLALSQIFTFEDTQLNRPESTGIVIINDSTQNVSDDLIGAFEQYDITPIKWSEKENYLEKLCT